MENNFTHGNYEDKYNTEHPIKSKLMNGFIKSFLNCFEATYFKEDLSICEIGCGEGELLKILHKRFPDANYSACDISPMIIEKAKETCTDFLVKFSVQDAQSLQLYDKNQFDIVICCEVLEHLENPDAGLKEIDRISKNVVVLSVPNEPLWRLLNILRGSYLSRLGNTPGHINHWSPRQFKRFVKTKFDFSNDQIQYPIPWQIIKIQK